MNPSDQLRTGADAITALIAGTRPDQMDGPTPCSEWSVRDVLNHVVGGAHMFAAAFSGNPAPAHDGPGDLIGDDPAAAWAGAVDAFVASIDAPGALDNMVPMPWGDTPGPMVYEILKFDILVHAWDLARATGQPFDPPADLVENTIGVAQMMLSPQMRATVFGPEMPVPDGASPIDRLAAFTGRTV